MPRKGDVVSNIADIVGVKTRMSPGIIGSAAVVWNPDIGITLNIGILTTLEGNLKLSTCTIAWSAPSQDFPEEGV